MANSTEAYDESLDKMDFWEDGVQENVDQLAIGFHSYMVKQRQNGRTVRKLLTGRDSVGYAYWRWATEGRRILIFPSYEFFLRVFIRILDVRERKQLVFDNPEEDRHGANGVLAGVLVAIFEPDTYATADPSDMMEGLKVLDPDAFAYAQALARNSEYNGFGELTPTR